MSWLWGGIGGLASGFVCSLQPEPACSRDDVLCRAMQAGLEESPVDVCWQGIAVAVGPKCEMQELS